MANSPKDSLQKFFVAWMNTSPAGIEEKKTLCAKLFEIDDKAAWDIFINLIYSGGGETITPLCEPRYISYRHFESRLPTKDIYNLYIFYENAINEHAKTANQFKQLFEKKSFLYFGEQAINDFINRVKNFCDNSPDDEKEIIIQSIREFVHKHREFQDAGWSASEKTIAKFENLISQIELKNKELGYVYLFDSWDVNVPHPIQYKHNNYSYEKTRETEQVYLDEQFNKFVKDKLDINYLYNYFNLHPDKLISDRFYYFSKRYEIDVKKRNIIEFIDLLQNKIVNSNNIFSFAGRDIYLNHYNDFYEIAKRIYESSKIDLFLSYFYAARIDCSDYGYMSIYNLLSDEDKARFWESIPNYIEIRQNDVDNLDFALSSLVATYLTQKKPNRYMSVLASFMYKYTKDDRGNLILKYLSLDYVKNLEIIVNAESWQIYEIIEMLHSDFAESDDQSIEAQIACVELLFIRNPDLREPIFLKNYLSRHPDLYYQFIFDEFINSKDNVSDKYRQNLLYLLHFGLKFCPAYRSSVFSLKVTISIFSYLEGIPLIDLAGLKLTYKSKMVLS